VGEVVRIAPSLGDDDLVSWIGEGALTQGVAKRFGWDIDETRRRLEKLARKGLLVKELVSMDASTNITGGRHAEWKSAVNAEIENRKQEVAMSAEISKDDVFITPDSDKLWDAVRIDRIEDGKVHFFPYHGGSVRSGTVEDFLDRFETISSERISELASTLTGGDFGLDEGKDYPGYASSQLWNGFFQPSFERETIEGMMADGFFSPEDGYGNLAWFDEEGTFFLAKTESGEAIPKSITTEIVKIIVENGSMDFSLEAEGETLQFEVEKCEGKTVRTKDGEKTLFTVGNNWVWQRADEPSLSPSA
jgi:hypothetical protein